MKLTYHQNWWFYEFQPLSNANVLFYKFFKKSPLYNQIQSSSAVFPLFYGYCFYTYSIRVERKLCVLISVRSLPTIKGEGLRIFSLLCFVIYIFLSSWQCSSFILQQVKPMGGNFLLLLAKFCQEKNFKFKIKNEMILEVFNC